MISSELPEVLGVSDRILVMREGSLVAEFSHAVASEEAVMSAAMGQHDPVSEAVRNDANDAQNGASR
jgi:rhamnose transport system ATP-binding protein